MKKRSVADILAVLDKLAPPSLAESWDNVGLLLGDSEARTSGAVVSTDLSDEAVQLATQKGYRLIVVHHPVIFPRQKGIARLVHSSTKRDSLQSLMIECIRRGISVAAAHTNFDRCSIEVSRSVARGIGFQPIGRVFEEGGEPIKKLVVFVPHSHTEAVRVALSQAGAGHIGRYDSCSFETRGLGTFRGLEGTRPVIGKPFKIESVQESRLEMVFPAGRKSQILKALRASHPYEEIAYDLISLEQSPSSEGLVNGVGYGVYGDFKTKLPLARVLARVKRTFRVRRALVTPASSVSRRAVIQAKRVAFTPGKGTSFVSSVRSLGCDLFVTGEVGYHAALDLARSGVSVIELGHRESEMFFAPTIAAWLKASGIDAAMGQTRAQEML